MNSVRIHTGGEVFLAESLAELNGLHVHKAYAGEGFVITHARSGIGYGIHFKSLATARKALNAVAMMADWRKSTRVLYRDPEFKRRNAAMYLALTHHFATHPCTEAIATEEQCSEIDLGTPRD